MQLGGYISNEYSSDDYLEQTIHIPADTLDYFLAAVSAAKSVADVVNVEKERSKVLEDLEAQIASMNTMKQQLSYSKVDITIHNLAILNSNDLLFTDGIQAAWQDSFSNFKELIYSIVRNWYWWIIIITIGLWGIQFYKRKKALQD